MPSGSRGSVATTSGLPHGQRCPIAWMPRGVRPSWAATAASSAAIDHGFPARSSRRSRSAGGAWGFGGLPASSHGLPLLGPPRGGGRAGDGRRVAQGRLALQRLAVLAQHDVRRLAGHHVAEPLVGLCLDERGVVPASLLALELVDAGLALRDLGLQVLDVRALLEVGPHRGGVGDRQHREDEHQDRRPAGEPRLPARPRARGWGRRRPGRAGTPRWPGRRRPPGPPRGRSEFRLWRVSPDQPWYRGNAAAPA